jgi:uncharacterized protein (TIGR00369 family)
MTTEHENKMDIETRIQTSFARQGLMQTLGAQLTRVAPGAIEIELAYSDSVTQQQGFVNGAAIAAIGDTACGYAALTLLPPNCEVVTVEYKINFVAPAQGARFIARGRVSKAGRTLSVCAGDVFAVREHDEKLVATLLATMMRVEITQ